MCFGTQRSLCKEKFYRIISETRSNWGNGTVGMKREQSEDVCVPFTPCKNHVLALDEWHIIWFGIEFLFNSNGKTNLSSPLWHETKQEKGGRRKTREKHGTKYEIHFHFLSIAFTHTNSFPPQMRITFRVFHDIKTMFLRSSFKTTRAVVLPNIPRNCAVSRNGKVWKGLYGFRIGMNRVRNKVVSQRNGNEGCEVTQHVSVYVCSFLFFFFVSNSQQCL